MSVKNLVAFTRVEDYEYQAVLHAVRRQFRLLGAAELVQPGIRVTVKPNLLMKREPQQHTTTHPMVEMCIRDRLYWKEWGKAAGGALLSSLAMVLLIKRRAAG